MPLMFSEPNRLLTLRVSLTQFLWEALRSRAWSQSGSKKTKFDAQLKCAAQLFICQSEEHPLVLGRDSLIVCSSEAAPRWIKNSRSLMASAGTCNQSPRPPLCNQQKHVVTTFGERCRSLVSSTFNTPIISHPLFLCAAPESEARSEWKAVRVSSHLWPFLIQPASPSAQRRIQVWGRTWVWKKCRALHVITAVIIHQNPTNLPKKYKSGRPFSPRCL